MNDQLMEIAYSLAIQQYVSAELSVFSDLLSQFPDTDFSDLLHAAEHSMQLHIAALGFARNVRGQILTYEKAEERLIAQFREFPPSTCVQAFHNAYKQTH